MAFAPTAPAKHYLRGTSCDPGQLRQKFALVDAYEDPRQDERPRHEIG